MKCPHCGKQGGHRSKGWRRCQNVEDVRRYRCGGCGRSFTQRTGTVLGGLRTPGKTVWSALHARTEGCGVRASGRLVSKTHGAVIGWEKRVAELGAQFPDSFQAQFVPVVESDEMYTKIGSNVGSSESRGWTACGIERTSRWCTTHVTGRRSEQMFRRHTNNVLRFIGTRGAHLVSDGETRYASELGNRSEVTIVESTVRIGRQVRHKPGPCLRKGLTIQRKVKGSQRGEAKRRKRYEIPLPHHPDSQLLEDHDVHANHSEAQNAALRRRCSAFRRRTNMYAKTQQGLDSALAAQRVVHRSVLIGLITNTSPLLKS